MFLFGEMMRITLRMYLADFALRHFSDVNEASVVFSWEMLKRGRLCEKFLKRKLERNIVAYLIAGKILRSAEIKFEIAESKSSLLLKNNIMHIEKHSCE